MKNQVDLNVWIENNHIQTEGGQTMTNGQVDFTDGSRTGTYTLRMGRRPSNRRIDFTDGIRITTYKLRIGRQREMVTDGSRTITYMLRWTDNDKLSAHLHLYVEDHVQAKDGQTTTNGQFDFTDGSRTGTYILKKGKQR